MNRRNASARQRIERAFHVSFMLPEQAARLLDEYRAEVRLEAFKEAEALVRWTPVPKEAKHNWHWFQFALNRAADRLIERISK